jgi:monofunctional biosynthetic peptidoglycan transglycosylase
MATRRKRTPKRRRRVGRRVSIALLLLVVMTAVPIVALRWIRPWTTAFMLQHDFKAGAACDRFTYPWAAWKTISPHVPVAILAAEDQRFPEHVGFDFQSIADALEDSDDGRRLRGASTISQQVAKNLFLWPGHSWVRKGLEAYLTVVIELSWPKRRILEVYVNIAQFGPCTFGVAAASEVFLAKPVSLITASEAALLAAVLPNPEHFRVDAPSTRVRQRAAWIRQQARNLGGPAFLGTL